MSKLRDLIKPQERIEDVEFSDIMSESYVDYAMSVIISRAVPDVRDGLKPVHRRAIFDMKELSNFHNNPHKKSARVVGDTLGKYHPHGSSSVYEALVVLSQPWKKMEPLIDGHGNFGSIEGDPAAADRYTELRLHKFTEDIFLEDLKHDTVDTVPNYDETLKEPSVLPCRIPHILINGSEGIAVGMTTSIPTHNTGEVIDVAIQYLKGIKDIDKLMKYLPGPDFPTGGIISNQSELRNIYITGNGKVKIRGRFEFEKGKGSEKDRLIITEIPYTMIGDGIKKFLQDTATLADDKILPEIHDIINQSSGDKIRIVLELRNGANIERIKNILYKKTKLEDTLGVNMLVVEGQKPKVMNLVEILEAFTQFQYQIYSRRYQKLLAQAEKKKEIDEGLIVAIDKIDVIIAVLRNCKNSTIAKECLMTGNVEKIEFPNATIKKAASKFNFTELQTDAILAMPLSRLIGLESDAIKQDKEKLDKDIEQYRRLIEDPNELKKEIIKFLQSAKKMYSKERKTEIINAITPDVVETEVPEIELTVLIDKFNYIQAIERSAYSRNKQFIDENFVHVIDISSKDKIAIFTNTGKVHLIPMKEVPIKKPRDKGVPLDNICQFNYKEDHIVGVEALQFKKDEKLFVFITSSGSIKATKNSEFFINRKITDSTILREGEEVFQVFEYDPKGIIVFETEKGLILKELQSNIKIKSKYSQGLQGIKLASDDTLKIVSTDVKKYSDVHKGSFGSPGKVKIKKLINDNQLTTI